MPRISSARPSERTALKNQNFINDQEEEFKKPKKDLK